MKNKSISVWIITILLIITSIVACACTGNIANDNNTENLQKNYSVDFHAVNDIAAQYEMQKGNVLSKKSGYNDDDTVGVIITFGNGMINEYISDGTDNTIAQYLNTEKGIEYQNKLNNINQMMIDSIKSSNISLNIRQSYSILTNGIFAEIRYGDIEKLSSLNGIKNVVVSQTYSAPKDAVVKKSLFGLNGIMTNETGYNGQGTLVAVLDTGIDLSHEAFINAPGNENISESEVQELYKSTNAYSISGSDDINEYYRNSKIPFAYDYADKDSNIEPGEISLSWYGGYHGTHVAGIIAGDCEKLQGVAPKAQLAIMKVFGDYTGGAASGDIVAALEDCVILGVDAVNLSLGFPNGYTYERHPDAQFINQCYDYLGYLGINVCAATGNDNSSTYGAYEEYVYYSNNLTANPDNGVVSSPASYKSTFAVASAVNPIYNRINFNGTQFDFLNTINNENVEYKFLDLLNGERYREFEFQVIDGIGTESDYEGIDVEGKIVVVKRGSSSFMEKSRIASLHGAIGCLIYNNTDGINRGSIATFYIPTATISLEAGLMLKEAGQGTIAIDLRVVKMTHAETSSMGALGDLTIGVDVMGIGDNVYSAINTPYAESQGASEPYAYLSGTSQATPNVVGMSLVLKSALREKYPHKTEREIKDMIYQIFMSTADILTDENENSLTPRRQGSGIVNINNAINAEAYITVTGSDRTKLNLGSDIYKEGIYTLNFNVVNLSDRELSYKINTEVFTETAVDGRIAEMAHMLNGRSVYIKSKNAVVNGDNITVAANSKAAVEIIITLSAEDKAYMDETFENGIYVEGFVKLFSLSNSNDIHIPYIAFYGDWYNLPVFDGTLNDYEKTPNRMGYTIIEEGEEEGESFYFGTYYYDIPDGYDEIAITDDYYAISDTFGPDMFELSFVRNVTNIQVLINDVLSETKFFDQSIGYTTKSKCYNGYYFEPSILTTAQLNAEFFGAANNQMVSITFIADFENRANSDSLTYNLFVDNEAPTLIGAKLNEENNLSLNIYDNHYLMSVMLYAEKDGELTAIMDAPVPAADFIKNQDNIINIDMNDYIEYIENGSIYVELVDFAKNSRSYKLDLTQTENTIINSYNAFLDEFNLSYAEAMNMNNITSSFKNNTVKRNNILNNEDSEEFVIEEGVLTGYNGKGGTVVIPQGVIEIGEEVFFENDSIEKVVCPEGMTCINENAFRKCLNLTTIELPSSLAFIGPYAFAQCVNLENINLENTSLSYIDSCAFIANKKIKEITLPDTEEPLYCYDSFMVMEGLTKITFNGNVAEIINSINVLPALTEVVFNKDVDFIGNNAIMCCNKLETISFFGNVNRAGYSNYEYYDDGSYDSEHSTGLCALPSLKTVNFYKDVNSIEGYSFNMCNNLTDVNFGGKMPELIGNPFSNSRKLINGFNLMEGNNNYVKECGIIYNAEKTMMYKPSDWDYDGVLTLPETITELKPYMFSHNLSGVVESQSVYALNDDGEWFSFYGTGMMDIDYERTLLKGIKLNSSIKEIPQSCFKNNINLKEINLENICIFGNECLYNTGITAFETSDITESVGYMAFAYCRNLSQLKLTENVEYTNTMNMYSGLNSMKEIVVPSFITSTCCLMTNNTGVEKVVFDSIECIEESCFEGCTALKTVEGIENVIEVGAYAFKDCNNLNNMKMEGLEIICEWAYSNCSNMTKVPYGNSITEIYDNAFDGCIKLSEIYIPCNWEPSIEIMDNVFNNCTGIERYTVEENHSLYCVYEGGLYSIDLTEIFKYPSANTNESLTLPDTITYVGEEIFRNAKNLKTIVMPNVTALDEYAFADSGLNKIVMDSVSYIGTGVFKGTNITEITLSDKLTFIGAFAFGDCEKLTSVTISDYTGDFDFYYIFKGSKNIKDININNNRNFIIYNGLFMSSDMRMVYKVMTSNETVSIPEGVVKVCAEAFINDTLLKQITLPSTLLAIGDKAFYGCIALKKIIFLSENAPRLEGIADGEHTYSYNNFVSNIDDMETSIEIVCNNNDSYNNYIWRKYFNR